jgi:hypothetical protein
MPQFARRRPSPALVVALVALFVALAGSGYAAVKLNGSQLVNRSVTGVKLKKNTVTGTEVKETSLGTVPSAVNANQLGGRAPAAFLLAGDKAADSDKLDGLDSSAFLQTGAKASDSDKLDGQNSTAFGLAGQPLRAAGANGVGGNAGCASGELGIVVRDGRSAAIDGRFSFQVPGPTPAYGQIRPDGSIRTSSANVTSVTHTTGSGMYCIHFSTVIGQAELEAAVAAVHENQ